MLYLIVMLLIFIFILDRLNNNKKKRILDLKLFNDTLIVSIERLRKDFALSNETIIKLADDLNALDNDKKIVEFERDESVTEVSVMKHEREFYLNLISEIKNDNIYYRKYIDSLAHLSNTQLNELKEYKNDTRIARFIREADLNTNRINELKDKLDKLSFQLERECDDKDYFKTRYQKVEAELNLVTYELDLLKETGEAPHV